MRIEICKCILATRLSQIQWCSVGEPEMSRYSRNIPRTLPGVLKELRASPRAPGESRHRPTRHTGAPGRGSRSPHDAHSKRSVRPSTGSRLCGPAPQRQLTDRIPPRAPPHKMTLKVRGAHPTKNRKRLLSRAAQGRGDSAALGRQRRAGTIDCTHIISFPL